MSTKSVSKFFNELINTLDIKRLSQDQIRNEFDKLSPNPLLRKLLKADLCEFGPISLAMENPNWQRIRIHGRKLIYRLQGEEQWREINIGFASEAAALMAIQRLVASVNRRVDDSIPVQRFRYKDAVVSIVLKGIAESHWIDVTHINFFREWMYPDIPL